MVTKSLKKNLDTCMSLYYKKKTSVLPLKFSVTCTCIFGNHWQSSEIFRKCLETIVWSSDSFWTIFENLKKVFGNVRKIIKKVITNTKQYVAACRYEFSLLVFNLISQLCAISLYIITQVILAF